MAQDKSARTGTQNKSTMAQRECANNCTKEIEMGYRSQVGYVIQFKKPVRFDSQRDQEKELDREYAKNLFYTFLAETKARTQTAQAWDDEVKDGKYVNSGESVKWGGALEVDYEQQLIKFRADDVKWYDSYPDVDCHNAMIDLAEEYIAGDDINETTNERNNGDYMSYTFVRIGENADDVETRSGGTCETDDYIYPVSTMQWDLPEP